MIGGNELVILLIAGLAIFGIKMAPRIGASLGKSLQSFKRAAKGIDEIDVTPVEPYEHEGEKGEEGNTNSVSSSEVNG